MNTNILSSKYFQNLFSEKHDGVEFQIVKPIGNPMILFSKIDGSPLAALHLRCQDKQQNSEIGKALITKRPYQSSFQCDFQGIINTNGQAFELVITNLADSGYINFNILKQNKQVGEVNPGGLNQINELRPFESYAVQCDQSNNRILILNAIEKPDKKEFLTVNEAEEIKTSNDPMGTYYFLSVVPEINKEELTNKFKETVWACADVFCLKKKIIEPMINIPESGNSGRPFPCLFGSQRFNTRNDSGLESLLLNNLSPTMSMPMESLRNLSSDMTTSMKRIKKGSSNKRNESSIQEKSSFGTSNDFDMDMEESGELNDDVIKNSFASEVKYGKEIQVNSYDSNIEYSYDHASAPCVLGLSISNKLEFKTLLNNESLLEIGKELISDAIKNQSKELLNKLTKIFEEDKCAICLDDNLQENPLDIIFYQCGHKCCHYDCAKTMNKCPLCRNLIAASIKI